MKRLIALCTGLIVSGASLAADPVPNRTPTSPAATFRTVSAVNVTQPLPTVMATALPPGAEYPATCGGASCSAPNCQGRNCDRTCLEKLADWFCFRPGPRVLPLCTPAPYHAPLRHYFPCHPGQCLAVGTCNPSAGCGAATGCNGRPGLFANRLGVFNRSCSTEPNGCVAANQAVVPQGGTIPVQQPVVAVRPTLRDRMMGAFSSLWPETPFVSYQNMGTGNGPTVVPAPNGYRYAVPGVQPAAGTQQSSVQQTGYQQPTANRPLTNSY